jgi:DNA-binding transcriptional LysR family regulator
MAAFVRVVDARGFSAAAPALGLSPSAVSKLVTRLEARLGVRLLQRTTRALSLTAEGEAFYAAARRIVGEIAALEAEIGDRRGTPHGLLRVTTSLTFSTHQLTPMIGEFLARYPAIQLELMPTDRMVDMVEEGIDVAIRVGRLPDSSFMARKIGDDVRLVCAAPSYLATHPAPRRPEDLAHHNCILSRDRARLQGLGIVRLTRLTLSAAVKRGELAPLLQDYSAEEPVPIHAVYPHRKHLASKVTAFVDFILEKFTPPPWEI